MADDSIYDLLRRVAAGASATELRPRHCETCRHFVKESDARRTCAEARCNLLNPEVMAKEREFLAWAWASNVVPYPDHAPDEDIAKFTHHLYMAGCVAPAFRRGASNRWERAVVAVNLRGRLHKALYDLLAWRAGALVPVNARMPQGDARKAWSEASKARDEADEWDAAQLADLDISIAEIARLLGQLESPRDPRTVKKLIESGKGSRKQK